jgi:hypothetical protein
MWWGIWSGNGHLMGFSRELPRHRTFSCQQDCRPSESATKLASTGQARSLAHADDHNKNREDDFLRRTIGSLPRSAVGGLTPDFPELLSSLSREAVYHINTNRSETQLMSPSSPVSAQSDFSPLQLALPLFASDQC